jgi:hypothetical protein
MKTELSKIAQDLEQGTITETEARKLLLGLLGVSGSLPSKDEIETASIDYREDSDEYDDEDMIVINWYDKQEAFQAGVKWFIENYR